MKRIHFQPLRALFKLGKGLVQRVIRQQRQALRDAADRVLPTNELMSDLVEKARYLGFGEGTRVYDSSCVFGPVQVGRNTWIGPFTVLDGAGGLRIGDHCSISAGVQIYTHDSVQWSVTEGRAELEYAPVQIGNGCYIGPNAVIAKGVTLGERCIVGANSYVNRSFDADSKLAGTPARRID